MSLFICNISHLLHKIIFAIYYINMVIIYAEQSFHLYQVFIYSYYDAND